MVWAWQQECRPTQRLVLLALANRAGENHECFPSIERLRKDTGLYRETIMAAISALENAGLIIVTRANGRGNRYTLVGVPDKPNQSAKADRSGKADRFGNPDCTSPEKPTGTSLEKPIQNLSVESIKNRKKKSDASPSRAISLDHLPDGISRDAAQEFIDHRNQLKKPLTQGALDRAMDLTISVGKKLKMHPDDVIRATVDAGWSQINQDWINTRLSKQSKQASDSEKVTREMIEKMALPGESYEQAARRLQAGLRRANAH